MYYSTTNTYEMKREIVNFSKKVANLTSKSSNKFLMDMQFGLAKGGSCLISNIARSLDEPILLNNVIDRLCDKLANLDKDDKNIIWENYIKEIKNHIDLKNPIAIFDNSDINKEYSRKLEDLDVVLDASRQDKKTVNGYHVCEAVVLSKNEKQPIPVYSEIYSCKSKGFKSQNTYTNESIDAVSNIVGDDFTGIFDRGYDDNKIYKKMSTGNRKFLVRVKDKRVLLFKGKRRSVSEVAESRKGKIYMKALFDDNEEVELSISYTKAVLPASNKEYTLVIVYGLKEDQPMKLLTNMKINDKKDAIRIVRLYLSRWRIEEHFRGKKQEYDFENMRVRTLESMNNLNMMLTIHLGHIAILADCINDKLLTTKIIYASKSLKDKSIVWLSQIARGIKNILAYAHTGIKDFQKIEHRSKIKYQQLELKI